MSTRVIATNGTWGGYVVSFRLGRQDIDVETQYGVRGFNIPVTVYVDLKSGRFEVWKGDMRVRTKRATLDAWR